MENFQKLIYLNCHFRMSATFFVIEAGCFNIWLLCLLVAVFQHLRQCIFVGFLEIQDTVQDILKYLGIAYREMLRLKYWTLLSLGSVYHELD